MRDKIFGSPSELIQWFKLNATKKKENLVKEVIQPPKNSRFTGNAPPPPPSSNSRGQFGRSRPPPPPPPSSSSSWSQNRDLNTTKKSSRFSDA